MKIDVNTQIAFTYLLSRRKQTIVASLGVMFGIGMFIFMNSLITGTNEYSEKTMLGTTPHVRIFKDHRAATPIAPEDSRIGLIINPQFVPDNNSIHNPDKVVALLQANKQITSISRQVTAHVIYSNGGVEENGNLFGVNILEQDEMFDISSTVIAGSVKAMDKRANSMLIGAGLARRLNVKVGDYVRVGVSGGVSRSLEVVGIFKTTVKTIDNTKSYCHIETVQQLLAKDRSYITEIYANMAQYYDAPVIAKQIESATGYQTETWQESNEQSLAGKKIRDIIANSVVITILVVAGFGIYNILNMVIYEKIREIAILKATGFKGRHVVSIFITQAMMIGVIGSVAGLVFGWFTSWAVSGIYIGMGNVSFLPMAFNIRHYVQGTIFGMVTAFLAGYIPAIRASRVDPVLIIRG